MLAPGSYAPPAAARGRTISLEAIRNFSIWLLFASGFLVFIEPAPFEFAFAIVFIVFALTGLRVSVAFIPLILLLILYNIGGGLSLMEVAEDTRAIWFVLISVYMAVMGIVIACIFAENTTRRLEVMQGGFVLAAVIASIAGIMGYFNIAGTGEIFTLNARATGTFKDPNVYSTFIVLPFILLVQQLVLGTMRRPFWSSLALLIILAGLFLSFSRGAWIVAGGGTLMCIAITFIVESSARMRLRIIGMALFGFMMLVTLLLIALQFEAIREIFIVRAELIQYYDGGETGRFGNQRRSIPMLLDQPNGLGPMMFATYFGNDPHNTYINAFSAYGWLGGISYLALTAVTVLVGFTLVFQRTPWQRYAIAIWSSLFLLILQGIQIDTDHWRHFYVQLGLTWGLMLATLRYRARFAA